MDGTAYRGVRGKERSKEEAWRNRKHSERERQYEALMDGRGNPEMEGQLEVRLRDRGAESA